MKNVFCFLFCLFYLFIYLFFGFTGGPVICSTDPYHVAICEIWIDKKKHKTKRSDFFSYIRPCFIKLADITPLHKKGAKSDRKNYRPVLLTSVVCKVCEMIVRQQLVQFWNSNEVFIPEQFGFLKGKSCLSQLLSSFHDWASRRNKGLTTDFIFLDLSKAFDSVPHERLLTKIHAYGIQGPLLSWLRSFLTNRYQRIVLRRHYSSWTSVLSGVPQGTVLGPILFLIYINDISRNIMSSTKLFADDMKLYRLLRDRLLRDTKKDVEELQKDLIRLESWSHVWQLKFNTDKCVAMHISKKMITQVLNTIYLVTN